MAGQKSEERRNVTYVLPTWIDSKQPVNLGIPTVEPKVVKTIVINDEPLEEAALEAFNSTKGVRVGCRKGDLQLWTDSLPAAVIHLGGTSKFLVAATVEGGLYIYSSAGRRFAFCNFRSLCYRLMPTIYLESVIAFLECSKDFLFFVTATGTASVW